MIEWFQPMIMGNPADEPVAVTYQFGQGYCFISTIWDGYLHNWANNAQWGRTGEGIIWHLDFLSSQTTNFWIGPRRGTIEPGQEIELTLTINSTGLIGGLYNGQIIFNSKDPKNPQQLLDITFTVEGNSMIGADPMPFPTLLHVHLES